MIRDFNNLGYKNAELLKYHLTKKIDQSSDKIMMMLSKSNNDFSGYIFSSLIDLLIVLLFSEDIKNLSIFCRALSIIALIIFFFVAKKIFVNVVLFKNNRKTCKEIMHGKTKYTLTDFKDKVDRFDNISCDYVLLCKNYIKKYNDVCNDPLEKNVSLFYIYEILYYYKNAIDNFQDIYLEKDTFINLHSSTQIITDETHTEFLRYKIDRYRANNFIDMLIEIKDFLELQINNIPSADLLLKNDFENIMCTLENFQKIT